MAAPASEAATGAAAIPASSGASDELAAGAAARRVAETGLPPEWPPPEIP